MNFFLLGSGDVVKKYSKWLNAYFYKSWSRSRKPEPAKKILSRWKTDRLRNTEGNTANQRFFNKIKK